MLNKSQAHRTISSLALPYRSYCHPQDTSSFFTSGSQDLLISPKGYAERRPGFSSTVESVPTTFNNLQRLFSWSDFSSNFITMACDVNASGFAQIYKRVVGVDNSFVSIFTSSSSAIFDFVVSNGTVYFSNGTEAKKWNVANGLSNWGIAIGSVNNATGPNGVGTGADVAFSGGTAWANPGNITANDGSFATCTLTQGGATSQGPSGFGSQSAGADWAGVGSGTATNLNPGGTNVSSALKSTNYGFNIPSNATINGIQVVITRKDNPASQAQDATVQLLKNGNPVGNNEGLGTFWPGTLTAQTYGGSSDLWGTTWTPTDINNSNFGVQLTAEQFNASIQITVTTVTIQVFYTPAAGTLFSDYLQGTNSGLSIGATNQILGILVEVKGLQSAANSNTQLQVQMLKGGNLVGTAKTGTNLPLSNSFVSFGGTSDLWGTTWTANDINQTNFGASLQAISNTSSAVTWSVDFVRITVFSLGGPAISVSGSAGTMSATTGYQYVFCYGSSTSGHISSPSLASASTGAFSNKLNVSVTLTASTDPQVNQIHVFRSTDSVAVGALAGAYFELPTSPYSNTNQNITDSTADVNLLTTSIAPTAGYNDPPTPFFGPVYFAGRVWGFKNNKVYFSGLEEIVNGVPEESFPSGQAGNFWTFNEPVTALAVAGNGTNQTLMIFCPGSVYGIAGNSLDTFRRFLLSVRKGCRSRTNVSSLDGMVAWIDTSTQVWGTDGTTVLELGQEIRTDLKTINQTTTSLTFHTSGEAHWLVLSTGLKLFVADIDLQRWMPPWSFACNYIGSYEVSLGTYALVAATSTTALQLNQSGTVGTYNDNGSTYRPIANLGLKPLVPDYSVFSAGYAEIASEPSRTGYVTGVQVDTNNNPLSDVLVMVDDDPTNAATVYTSISANAQTPQVAYNRGQGKNIVQRIYPCNKEAEGRWAGVRIKGQQADDNLRLYSMFIGENRLGAR